MPASALGPTLLQVRTWDTEHLTEAAAYWTGTATVWGDAFTNLSAHIPCPGGSPWVGDAAEAAQHRADADKLTVMGLADQLHHASAVARAGARDIDAAKQGVLAAVNAARDAGFIVGEDFSVVSRESGLASVTATRQAQAQALAADIRAQLAALIATDQQVAAMITAAAAGVGTAPDSGHPTIQAVNNRTVKQAPPQPEPPDPSQGPMPPINDAEDVKRVLDPLQNGGRRGPNSVGTKTGVKEVWDRGSVRQLWENLTRSAADADGWPGYRGPVRMLPDGTMIGLRQSGKGWDDTIDIRYPDGTRNKIHTPYAPYFPSIGTPPQLGPPPTAHAPVAVPSAGIFEPSGLPPWLQNPSAPGIQTPVQTPTIMPGVALPDAPSASVTTPANPGFLPDLGHDLAEASKTAGAGVLAGVVIIGGLLTGGVTPSGQIAR
ncbi:WXG100 family type VII secretion target [Mycobacterium sp. URHB0021]